MIETFDTAEKINNGIVQGTAAKKYINLFCSGVEKYMNKCALKDVKKAYDDVLLSLIRFSTPPEGKGTHIRPISFYESFLDYFFDQKLTIPANVCYWLKEYYKGYIELTNDTRIRETHVYKTLRKAYIDLHRLRKSDDKYAVQYEKGIRRKMCRMYRSGAYAATFELYGKRLLDIINQQEAENIETMLLFLFSGQPLNSVGRYADLTIGYILGRIQGRSEAYSGT